MKEWFEIEEEWNELIDIAKNECVFGEQLDNDLFKRCINDAFEFFGSGKEKKTSFNNSELAIYGLIYGYSCIPAVTGSEYSDEFEASTHVASELAGFIRDPGLYKTEGNKLVYEFMIDGDFKSVVYDFETGDLSDYIELVKMHYWDL